MRRAGRGTGNRTAKRRAGREPANGNKPAACRGMERREPFTCGLAWEAATGPSRRSAGPCAPHKFVGPRESPSPRRGEKGMKRVMDQSCSAHQLHHTMTPNARGCRRPAMGSGPSGEGQRGGEYRAASRAAAVGAGPAWAPTPAGVVLSARRCGRRAPPGRPTR
jgi:hypothetical protein